MPTSQQLRERPEGSGRRRRRDGSSPSHASGKHSSKHTKTGHSGTSAGRTGSMRPVKRSASRPSSGNPSRTGTSKKVQANGAVGYKSSVSSKGGKHRRPSHAAVKKKGFPVWGIFLILLLVAGLGVGGFFLVQYVLNPYEGARVEDGQEVTVVIPEGSTGADITQILLDAGVIHSSKDFRKAAQEQNADQSLMPGTYSFLTGSDPSEVIAQLMAGPNSNEGMLQVPEGLTVTQTAQLVESSLGIPQKEFVEQAKASNYVDDYSFLSAAGKDSLEGFLYPKTYDFSGKEVSADAVIRLMLDQYAAEVDSLDLNSYEQVLSDRYNLNVTDYDILKIASIIEKEALNEDDRTKISSVFYNRLSSGTALESDATMSYVTGGAVSADDLKTDSAYNTYLHKGLPPTPICSPSLWAIMAALEPAETDYYFFFIIDDGVYSNHTFSKTFEEHHEAYKKALKEQAEANGTAEPESEEDSEDESEEATSQSEEE